MELSKNKTWNTDDKVKLECDKQVVCKNKIYPQTSHAQMFILVYMFEYTWQDLKKKKKEGKISWKRIWNVYVIAQRNIKLFGIYKWNFNDAVLINQRTRLKFVQWIHSEPFIA